MRLFYSLRVFSITDSVFGVCFTCLIPSLFKLFGLRTSTVISLCPKLNLSLITFEAPEQYVKVPIVALFPNCFVKCEVSVCLFCFELLVESALGSRGSFFLSCDKVLDGERTVKSEYFKVLLVFKQQFGKSFGI